MKFEIGDIIAANKSSNKKYNKTTELNKWIGIVTHVNEEDFTAKTIYCERKIEYDLPLDYKYFDLIKRFDKIKMTHTEIAKELGYDFELIEEEEE